jgi:hypothetical protein
MAVEPAVLTKWMSVNALEKAEHATINALGSLYGAQSFSKRATDAYTTI